MKSNCRLMMLRVLMSSMMTAAPATALHASTPPYETLIDIGNYSGFDTIIVSGVSDDGTVISGLYGASERAAYYSSVDNRWYAIDSGVNNVSASWGVSGDGSTVFGRIYFPGVSAYKAFAYDVATGQLRNLGALGGNNARSFSWASSYDGSVIVGQSALADITKFHAFRYTKAEGMVDLGTFGGPNSSAYGITPDGSVIVGDSNVTGAVSHAFRHTKDGGMVDLGTLGGSVAIAYDVSDDGNLIVGSSRIDSSIGTRPFLYSWPDRTMKSLGSFGGTFAAATAISGDGTVIVGYSYLPGDTQYRAFKYTEKAGMVDLGTLGGLSSYASDISADGALIVGYSYLAGETVSHAFIYRNIMVDVENTYAALSRSAARLDDVFNLQRLGLMSLLDAECTSFGPRGLCLAVGGRYDHALDGSAVDDGVGSMRLGYRFNRNLSGGVAVDYAISQSMPTGYHVVRTDPAVGVFATLSQREDGTGPKLRLSASASGLRLRVKRDRLEHTEGGEGSTGLDGMGVQGELSWGWKAGEHWLVQPYAGLRYLESERDGYTEEGSVEFPVSYASVHQEMTTLFAGLRAVVKLSDRVGLRLTGGVEHEVGDTIDGMSGTIDVLGPFSVRAPGMHRTRGIGNVGCWYRTGVHQRLAIDAGYRQPTLCDSGRLQVGLTWKVGL
jgi:probable HAF family extracellular repeat protein